MRFSDLFALILDNLGRRKGRVVLTAVGVVIGTAAVVTLVSLVMGLQKNATSNLWGISDLSSITVYPGFPQTPGAFEEADIKRLTDKALADIQAIEGVKMVVIQDSIQTGTELSYERLITWANVVGTSLDDMAEMSLEAAQGVTQIARGKVVIGSWVPRNFMDPKPKPGTEGQPVDPPELLGKTLKMVVTKWSSDGVESKRTFNLEVVGILKETRGEADSSIYMPMQMVNQINEWVTGKRTDRNKTGYNQFIVKANSPENTVSITEQINELGFMAYTPQAAVQGINSFFTIMQLIFGGVGAIALLVAAIGIANTMTMAILERTREIGIMKAIGATNNNILAIFLGEAAGIGFIGGIGGVLLGWIINSVINLYATSYLSSGAGGTTIATAMPVWLPIFSIAFATLVGLLSGLYPALNAATLVPINALKYE